MTKLIKNLIIYPENIQKNLNLTRGLIYSQTIMLRLIDRGLTREEAYALVQKSSMEVWTDKDKNLKAELLKSGEVLRYLDKEEIENIFNSSKMLENVDYIFKRSIYS